MRVLALLRLLLLGLSLGCAGNADGPPAESVNEQTMQEETDYVEDVSDQ